MPRTESLAGFVRSLVSRWVCVLLLPALSAGTCRAQPVLASGRTLITSIHQFWALPAEEKARVQEFEIECVVTYFDPGWRILFVEDRQGGAAYVPYGDNAYPFKPGEWIVARGRFIPPNVDISFEHATVRAGEGPPLAPLPATEAISQSMQFHNRYVSVVGFVDRERRSDESHLQLTLSVNGQLVLAWVLMNPQTLTPRLADRKVRVEGVYNGKVAPDGTLEGLEILVSSIDHVAALGRIEDDPGFQLPVTAINQLARRSPRELVRIVGTVVERNPGRSLRVRDAGGQAELFTGQMRPLAINDVVEAIGYPATDGTEVRLNNAIFRAYTRTVMSVLPGEPDTLGLAADVMRLSAEEAAQGRSVWLTGVVTWSHVKAPFFFIHDSSGGICIMRGNSTSPVRSPGRNVQVRGVTSMGDFAPVVIASSFDRVSEAVLPVARHVSVEHALTGVEEAQWVEMRGYLRRSYREGDWTILELATATSDFTAALPATEDVSSMIGSVVRLHGACAAETDRQRKLVGVRLWVPGIAYVQVEEPAPADPFLVPARSLASLGQYETVQAFNRRVRVAGTVLQHSRGHAIRLTEAGHSLLVFSRGLEQLRPSDRIEAVGFLGRQGGRVTLREAVYRLVGSSSEPKPRRFSPHDAPTPALDGQLVEIEGTIVAAAMVGRMAQLTIQAPQRIFEVSLDTDGSDFLLPEPNSRVTVAGVYEVGYDEHGRPESFALLMRSPSDLAVLESPSWWTRGRILASTGIIALLTVLVLGWVTVLRRQVRRQTSLIRDQMEREGRMQAELARAGKLESLGLLAGGIAHDFNNLLTVLMGNISLVRLDPELNDESAGSLAQAEKAAGRARDLTQQLLTFAKGGAPLRTAVSLPEVVREVAEFALRGSKVRCRFHPPEDLWPANVDKGQIGQVVQNIVINALQAMPEGGVVDIALSNQEVASSEMTGVLAPGRYVRLDFADQGPGIAPGDLGRIFDPYFTTKKQGSGLGLATVHSIVKQHAGHITANSQVGRGTTFHVWLPAAESEALHDAPASPPPEPAVRGREAPRVLLMDDEEFIRKLGCSILERFGYRTTALPDGVAALEEYRRGQDSGDPYRLVILDLTIPGGMGGRETIEALMRLDPGVRAIVSSGYSNDRVLANYRAHGFRGMISKPYDVADFAHAVERVLKGERA